MCSLGVVAKGWQGSDSPARMWSQGQAAKAQCATAHIDMTHVGDPGGRPHVRIAEAQERCRWPTTCSGGAAFPRWAGRQADYTVKPTL